MVITLKPGPQRKIRLVVLKRAAEEQWKATVLDIRVAFLNAPLDEQQETPTMVVLKPPALLIKTGHVKHNEYYLAQKAMYGLRQSPRCWGLHRDGVLRSMNSDEGHHLVQSAAEPNLWAILKGEAKNDDVEGGELKGFLLVYVDDLMVVGDGGTIEVITKMLQAEWETSPPEEVNTKDKVKLLGMELKKGLWGEFIASQEDYIKDKEGIEERKGVKVGKDLCPLPEEPTPDLVTQAQKLVGELMWLSTRTRPDIAFATSRCAQEILSHPMWVVEQEYPK